MTDQTGASGVTEGGSSLAGRDGAPRVAVGDIVTVHRGTTRYEVAELRGMGAMDRWNEEALLVPLAPGVEQWVGTDVLHRVNQL